MALAYYRMLIRELLNNDTYIVPYEYPLIILDIKYSVCMDNNGKDTNHTMHIYRGVNFVINDEKFKMHKIECCNGGMKLAYISTKNSRENDLNPRMKYIMVRLEILCRKLVQEGLHNT